MQPDDPLPPPDVARRERRLRAELEKQARTARRRLDAIELRARRDLERKVDSARRSATAATSRPGAAVVPRRSGDATGWEQIDDKLLVWALPAAAIAALPLVAGHLAAVLVGNGAPSYPIVDAPGILVRLLGDLGDPARAWEPVNTGGAVPGPVAYWVTFLLIVLVPGLVGLLVWTVVRPPATAARGWGTADDRGGLRARPKEPHRLVLGVADNRRLAVRERHSLLVVGPAHAGKTSGLVVPAVLEWEGPVVVASAKGHLVDETIGWRSRQGEVDVYDPAATTRYSRSTWSPLHECSTWHGAIRVAAGLTLAVRAGGRGDDLPPTPGGGDAWQGPLSMALAPYLLAGVASGRPISQVAEWIGREDRDDVLAVLEDVDEAAARTHRATFARTDAARTRFLHAVRDVLTVYDDPIVASSVTRQDIEPDRLLDGGNHTLYLTAPEHDQQRFRPLCALLVRHVLEAAYESSARLAAPLDPPLLVVLDDVAGIAPLYDLATLASTAAARGVQLVSVFQDRTQIAEQYGDDADMVVRNHAARLVLAGAHGWRADGRGTGGDELLAPELASDLGDGEAGLVYGSHRPIKVALRPWYRNRELRQRVETAQDAVRPVADRAHHGDSWLADQTAVWRRRAGDSAPVQLNEPATPPEVRDRRFHERFGSLDEDDTGPIDIASRASRASRSSRRRTRRPR